MQNAMPITKARSRTSKAAKNAEPNAGVPTDEATTDEATTDEATTDEATTDEATTEPRTASPAPKPAATVDTQIVERLKPTVSDTVDGTEPTTATCQHPNSHITRNVGVTCARNSPAAWVPSWPSGGAFHLLACGLASHMGRRSASRWDRRDGPGDRPGALGVPATTQHSPPASRCSPRLRWPCRIPAAAIVPAINF